MGQSAALALGFTGVADPAPVPNQPMVSVFPKMFRKGLHQLLFGLFRSFAAGQT